MTDAAKAPRVLQARQWLQLRIALACLAVVAAGSAIMAAALLPRLQRALGLEMHRGHSGVVNTWQVVRDDVVAVNLVMAAAVLLVSAAVALAILSSVHRAARALARDIRAALAGGDPAGWAPVERPREMRRLQKELAAGIASHRARLAEMDGLCGTILEQARAAPAGAAGRSDLRGLHVLCERLRSHARHIRTE